jgi:putative ATP-dependent endonuclease of OLD family
VRTFVADHWTLEYDLAFCGLAEEVYVAASLAKNDSAIMEGKKTVAEVEAASKTEYEQLVESAGDDRAVLCSQVYRLFHSGGASKAIAAQYLANALTQPRGRGTISNLATFAGKLPPYLLDAIAHVTGGGGSAPPAAGGEGPAPPAEDVGPVEDTDG